MQTDADYIRDCVTFLKIIPIFKDLGSVTDQEKGVYFLYETGEPAAQQRDSSL